MQYKSIDFYTLLRYTRNVILTPSSMSSFVSEKWQYSTTAGDHQFAIYKNEHGQDLAYVRNDDEHAENRARLMASAPELLETLMFLRDEYCEGGSLDGTEAERKIKNAIAQAEG